MYKLTPEGSYEIRLVVDTMSLLTRTHSTAGQLSWIVATFRSLRTYFGAESRPEQSLITLSYDNAYAIQQIEEGHNVRGEHDYFSKFRYLTWPEHPHPLARD